MPEAAINGTTIHYDETGSGFPCLAMHGGLGFDSTYLRTSLGPLADRFRLITFDHRNNGKSGRPPLETLTMEQLADDARALLQHLGVERAVIWGHSYGGFVAQELALRHPACVAALVLVTTTPGQLGSADDPPEDQGEPPPAEFLALLSRLPETDAELAAAMPALLPWYAHTMTAADFEPFLGATRWDAAALVRGMEALARWSSVDRLGEIAAPTLLLAGRRDIVTSWQQSRRIARRIPGAEMVVIEEAGHFPWIEQPEAFWAALNQWLDKHPAG